MNYEELEHKIYLLHDYEFGIPLIEEITIILARTREKYLRDFTRRINSKEKYDFIMSLINNLLRNKIEESELDISRKAIDNIINAIMANTMFIDGVKIIDNIVLLTGKNIFDKDGVEISKLFDARLRDITSREFVDFCKKITYFNSPVGRKVIERLVIAINTKLKEFLGIDRDTLINIDGNVLCNNPLLSIYSTMGLNDMCNDIFYEGKALFRLIIKNGLEDVHVFRISIDKENIDIRLLNIDVVDIKNDENKKTLHK